MVPKVRAWGGLCGEVHPMIDWHRPCQPTAHSESGTDGCNCWRSLVYIKDQLGTLAIAPPLLTSSVSILCPPMLRLLCRFLFQCHIVTCTRLPSNVIICNILSARIIRIGRPCRPGPPFIHGLVGKSIRYLIALPVHVLEQYINRAPIP